MSNALDDGFIAPLNIDTTEPLFPLGRIGATPGALDALDAAHSNPATFLARHERGDWGDVCADDKQLNAQAVRHGSRILSAYTLSTSVKVWIITEGDRSATTILLPEEY